MMWFGKTGVAFFDRWSLVHFAFWWVVCADLRSRGVRAWIYWLVALGGAYLWEVIESTTFEKWGWVAHPESPLNRWVSDPLMAVLAGVAAWYLMKGQ